MTATAPRLRVLFVDDDEAVREVLGYVLGERVDLDLVGSAKAALDRLASHAYDVLVTDQRMPDMTGVELCAETVARFPRIRRIILTAYTDADAMEHAINEGRVNGWVRKPFDEKQLIGAIEGGATRPAVNGNAGHRLACAEAAYAKTLQRSREQRKSWDPREKRDG